MMILRLLFICLCSCILHSCLYPAIVGGGSALAFTASKDKKLNDSISDTLLSVSIKAKLMNKHIKKLFSNIDVEVIEGNVLYIGIIESENISKKAEEIAFSTDGVKKVINELIVDKKFANSSHPIIYTQDTTITTAIKSSLLLDKRVKSVNYIVNTLRGTVYIFGKSKSQLELDLITQICKNTKGVKNIVIHTVDEIDAITYPNKIVDMPQDQKPGQLLKNDHDILQKLETNRDLQ